MNSLCENVVAANRRLVEGHGQLAKKHRSGCSGVMLCAEISDLRDQIIGDLFDDAIRDVDPDGSKQLGAKVALVAHGGYGRRDVSPYSDVDLMILHWPSVTRHMPPLAQRFTRDVVDVGLTLGHSVRTPDQAAGLAVRDPLTATSLMESRLLTGDEQFYSRFFQTFSRQVRRQLHRIMTAVLHERRGERARFGETVYLLEPNVKRSPGTLRDLQLLRWIGFLRHGTSESYELEARGALTGDDRRDVEAAAEFLLRLRNEMHFHADKPADVLDRGEQLRIAALFGYKDSEGMLPVERFMRDYFRHSNHIKHLVDKFAAAARTRPKLTNVVTAVFGHQVDRSLHVGPAGVMATSHGLDQVRGNLTTVIRMADMANLYDKPIVPQTWEAVRREVSTFPDKPSTEACRHFLSLLKHPARLAALLRDLHDVGVLERFVPAMKRARGLLQFNQYHKYTVDEHCIRAVEAATDLFRDTGPLGREYRQIEQRHILHLALLIHDLGKGFEEDHSEIGLRIAKETAERLGLPSHEAEMLKFLVHKHLMMNRLAFRRDTSDEQLIVEFARGVGSPDVLRMLFVLTAADLTAVGPGVWDGWKSRVLTDLYAGTMARLSDAAPAAAIDEQLVQKRQAVVRRLRDENDAKWFTRQIDGLPSGYFSAATPEQIIQDLHMLRGLSLGTASAASRYVEETESIQITVGAREKDSPGAFHRLTGALSGLGLRIRSAQINTLTDGLVLDRFWVSDPDYSGNPPSHRMQQIDEVLVKSLSDGPEQRPTFRKTWTKAEDRISHDSGETSRVSFDNSSSPRYTIFDVFTQDRGGVLYDIAKTLFEMGLSVHFAKIGTYVDQVVDVFYVSDSQGEKISDQDAIEEIRTRLAAVASSAREE